MKLEQSNVTSASENENTLLVVALPWPPSVLTPNRKAHWVVAWKAKRNLRVESEARTRAALAVPGAVPAGGWAAAGRLRVAMAFHAPTRQQRDWDGAVAASKAALDGMAAAMGVDDSVFAEALIYLQAEPVKGGAVVVTVTPVEASGRPLASRLLDDLFG